MIRVLDGLPDGVLGLAASGKLTAHDYTDVLAPALEAASAGGGHLLLEGRAEAEAESAHQVQVAARGHGGGRVDTCPSDRAHVRRPPLLLMTCSYVTHALTASARRGPRLSGD